MYRYVSLLLHAILTTIVPICHGVYSAILPEEDISTTLPHTSWIYCRNSSVL